MSVFNNIFKEMDSLIISALGVITALAWNTAFQNFFDSKPLLKKYGPWIYAIVVTIIAILIVALLEKIRIMNDNDNNDNNDNDNNNDNNDNN